MKAGCWVTYMAVEQAVFVSGNPFRLLEVFNRHFKLKEKKNGHAGNIHRVKVGEGGRERELLREGQLGE